MKTKLPDPNQISVMSHEETSMLLRLLVTKINEIEEREPERDRGLAEEILHLRKETREGFENIDQRFEKLETKVDQNTLAIKSLEQVTGEKFSSLESVMKGGFDSVGKLLQEISNKLD